MKRIVGSAVAFVFVTGFSLGCREEGPAEQAGRKIDEAIEEIRHGDEGALEKAGRKLDETVEGAQEKAEELKEEAREATR